MKGINVLPLFQHTIYDSNDSVFTNAMHVADFINYKIAGASPVSKSGINLQALFNINTGEKDFNDQPVNKNCCGACTNK